jgi:hypothetical protein
LEEILFEFKLNRMGRLKTKEKALAPIKAQGLLNKSGGDLLSHR